MKKLLIIALAASFCLAFAMPAMAKVTVGGMITLDMYYQDLSSERQTFNGQVQGAAAVADDFSEMAINLPQANNRLIVRYKSDDGDMTGYIQMRGGGANGGNAVDYKYAWLDWRLNDFFHFRAGRQPQAFAVMTPGAANMGFSDGWTLLANFGNIQVTDGDSIKFYFKFSDLIRMELQVEDPRNNSGGGLVDGGAGDPNRSNPAIPITEENVIPKFDFALPITFGSFTIEPSATWMQLNFDGKQGDDNVDIWGVCLGARAGFGPVTISGEIIYGENLGSHQYAGAGDAGPWFATQTRAIARYRALDGNGDGINEVYDAEMLAGWIQLAIKFGPATLQMAFGMEDIENDGTAAVNDEVDVTRYGYAVSLPIAVTKGFKITPAIIYHDRGNSELDGVNNPLTVDYGDEYLVGVQFGLSF
jgi:hypothetical protein